MIVNRMQQIPGGRLYDSTHISNSRGNNGRRYPTIRPKCYIAAISLLFFVTIASIASILGIVIYFQFPASQGSFYTQSYWCFISDIENECLDPSLWWARDNDLLSKYDFYDDDKCETDKVEEANTGAFCNTKPGQTIDWCIGLANTIVSNKTECADFEASYVFTTPEQYDVLGYTYVHDSDRLAGSYFYGVGIAIVVWLTYAILSTIYFPVTVQRQGSNIVFHHSCSSSVVRLADVQFMIVLDRYNRCFHSQFLKGIMYMTSSCLCGAGEEGACTFVIVRTNGMGFNFQFSLRANDAQQFMEDNILSTNNPGQDSSLQLGIGSHQVYPVAELASVKQKEELS